MIESAKLNGINPATYLDAAVMAAMRGVILLPHQFAASACHQRNRAPPRLYLTSDVGQVAEVCLTPPWSHLRDISGEKRGDLKGKCLFGFVFVAGHGGMVVT